MHTLTRVASIVFVTFAATTCSGALPTQPTQISTEAASTTLSVRPSTLIAQPVGHFNCPAVPPFALPFHLFVQSGDASLAVTNITMRFVDTTGAPMPQVTLPMPQVTLPAPVPTTQVGTGLAESRDLPLSLAIGCATGHTGTLTVIVATVNGRGHEGSAQLAVNVR